MYMHGSILTDEQLQEALLLPALHVQYQCNDMLTQPVKIQASVRITNYADCS